MIWGYALFSVIVSGWLFEKRCWQSAITAVIFFGVLYFGITAIPWAAFILIATLLAWQVGGAKIAVLSILGWSFMLFSGVWPQAMLSVYIPLGKADPGLGMVAGLDMDLIANIADRNIQSWSLKRKEKLGLSG